MSYTFKELSPGTYQVEEHTIIKDGNGQWVADPPIEKPSLQKAFLNYIRTLDV
jgi:hypothetical protein